MPTINEIVDAKIQEQYRQNKVRDYLGASILGEKCQRKIQLIYLGNMAPVPAQSIRTFDVGHNLEPLVAEWLIVAGFDLKTKNEQGEQYGFSVIDGHFQGHVDGIIYKFPSELSSEKVNTPCIWECKTLNQKSWSETAAKGVIATKPLYYAQVQLYMAYLDAEWCLFTALNKNTSELYFELIPFEAESAQMYSDRAAEIIKACTHHEILPKISEDPCFFYCKMCSVREICRKNES